MVAILSPGRLTGLLFADQGAEVLVLDKDVKDDSDFDPYLNRNKRSIAAMESISVSSIDRTLAAEEHGHACRVLLVLELGSFAFFCIWFGHVHSIFFCLE